MAELPTMVQQKKLVVSCDDCSARFIVKLCQACEKQIEESHTCSTCSTCDAHYCGHCMNYQYETYENEQDNSDGFEILSRCNNCDPLLVQQRTNEEWKTTLEHIGAFCGSDFKHPTLSAARTSLQTYVEQRMLSSPPVEDQTKHASESKLLGKRKANDINTQVVCGTCKQQLGIQTTFAGRTDSDCFPKGVIACKQCIRPYCKTCAQNDPGWSNATKTLSCCLHCSHGERSDQRAKRLKKEAECNAAKQAIDASKKAYAKRKQTSITFLTGNSPLVAFQHFCALVVGYMEEHELDALGEIDALEMKTCFHHVTEDKTGFQFTFCPPDTTKNPYAKCVVSFARRACEEMLPSSSSEQSAAAVKMRWLKTDARPVVVK